MYPEDGAAAFSKKLVDSSAAHGVTSQNTAVF